MDYEELAREARYLRLEQERIKLRLAELAEVFEGREPVVLVEDGEKYKVTTSFRTTLKIEESKMRAVDPTAYDKCAVTTVSETLLRQAITRGQVKKWERYASFEAGAPYMSIKKVKESTIREENEA